MDIVHKKFAKQRYIGLLTVSETQHIVGPFQSFPLSLIPKPGHPGKYRMIQDLSHPRGVTLGSGRDKRRLERQGTKDP